MPADAKHVTNSRNRCRNKLTNLSRTTKDDLGQEIAGRHRVTECG